MSNSNQDVEKKDTKDVKKDLNNESSVAQINRRLEQLYSDRKQLKVKYQSKMLANKRESMKLYPLLNEVSRKEYGFTAILPNEIHLVVEVCRM